MSEPTTPTPKSQQEDTAKQQSSHPQFAHINILIVILICAISIFLYLEYFPQVIKASYAAIWILFGFMISTFLIFFGFRAYLTKFLFGSKEIGASDVLKDVQQISNTLIEQGSDKVLAHLPGEQRARIKLMLPKMTDWFIWKSLRNWYWQWIIKIFVSIVGLTGTMLLMNQNELLNNQNILIQRQISLEEASRRSALVVLMSNIMDKVDREIEKQQDLLPQKYRDTARFQLSQSLIGQIAALSHSFKPYRYMSGDTLIPVPLSPERGQLLITLSLLPLDTTTIQKIYFSATFESADLKLARLSNAYLKGIRLEKADLEGARLKGTDLRGANLRGTNLKRIDLEGANLERVNLNLADMKMAYLVQADLREANINGADLGGTMLTKANLSGADLVETDIRGADLSAANLTKAFLLSADLSNANLEQTDLSNASLSKANVTSTLGLTFQVLKQCSSLYQAKGIPQDTLVRLKQEKPELFDSQKFLDAPNLF